MRWIFLVLLLFAPTAAHAVVHGQGAVAKRYFQAKGELTQVGKVLYSPLRVLGGSCVAIGGRWALTSKHGTDRWPADSLAVKFPFLDGDATYSVVAVSFPEKGDLALLKLDRVVDGAARVPIANDPPVSGAKVRLAGFGISGFVGNLEPPGRFSWGENTVEWAKNGRVRLILQTKERRSAILAKIDSGSPLFVKSDSGWELAGIGSSASHGANPKDGSRCTYAGLAQAKVWIENQIGQEAL